MFSVLNRYIKYIKQNEKTIATQFYSFLIFTMQILRADDFSPALICFFIEVELGIVLEKLYPFSIKILCVGILDDVKINFEFACVVSYKSNCYVRFVGFCCNENVIFIG